MNYFSLDNVLYSLKEFMCDNCDNISDYPYLFYRTLIKEADRIYLDDRVIDKGMELIKLCKNKGMDYRILTSMPSLDELIKYNWYKTNIDGENVSNSLSYVLEKYDTIKINKLKFCVMQNIPIENVIIVNNKKDKLNYVRNINDLLYDTDQCIVDKWNKFNGTGVLFQY